MRVNSLEKDRMRLFISLMSVARVEELDVLRFAVGYTYMDCSVADVTTYGVEVLGVAFSQGPSDISMNTRIKGHGGSFLASIKLFSTCTTKSYVSGKISPPVEVSINTMYELKAFR